MIKDINILYRYFEGKASDSEVGVVRKWLDESPENKGIFMKERKLYDVMHLSGKPEPVIIKAKTKIHPVLREIYRTVAVSAVVLLFIFIYREYRVVDKEDVIEQFQTISVPVGQRINITLPDGTTVWLNARTTIKYPLTFNKEKRQVSLDGEAYFEVVEDKKKPFVVQTSKGSLEVLGTEFNVEDYSDMENFETMLFGGSVRIVPNDSSLQAVTLNPTYKASLDKDGLSVVQVDDYSVYRWREGLICFKDDPFSKIMNDFEKYYGLKIIVENDNVKKQYYSGKFRQTDGIDYALRVLQKDIRFDYARDDDNSVIYIK